MKYFFVVKLLIRNNILVSTLSLYSPADNNLVLLCFAKLSIATDMSASLLARIVFPTTKFTPIDWDAIRQLSYRLSVDKALCADPAVKATISKFIEDWVASCDYLDYMDDHPNSTLTIQEYINQIFVKKDYSEMDCLDGTAMCKMIDIYKLVN